ncbi:transmembrane protein 41A-A-like [Mytilus galloprovincialis]|uniref:transmembrane protein 41A-A-like n=1 Tax=Mytilus galloprovincialis TaxID=29158 RepID=UPI003F7C6D02
MGSVIWIPTVLGLFTAYLYILSTNVPELKGVKDENARLNFPSNLEELTSLASTLQLYKTEHLLYVLLLFCSAYIYKQTFAIPGSVFLNLLGGALFGVWTSFPLVCVLSATGASCCFLLSKYFGKQHIERFFPDKVRFLQGKVEVNKDSLLFFLLFLRFFPMTPNWFLNMASPIVNVPIHLFFLSVLIGLMPFNFICVQTGGMLSEIKSTDDIFTSGTLIKLGAIAVVALVPGMIVKKMKDRKTKSE